MWIDRSALGLSGLCLTHCLAGTLVIALLSSAGGFWNHQVHAIGLLLALPLAVLALWRGVRRHRRTVLLLPAGVGLLAMAAGAFGRHGTAFEIGATVAGVLLLSAAHLFNIRWLGDSGRA